MSLLAEVRDLNRRRQERPLPPVEVEHGPALPGGVLKTAAALAVAGLAWAAGSRTEVLPALCTVIALGLAVWTVLRPGPVPSHLAVVLAGVTLLGSSGPFDVAVLGIAPLAYLTVRLGWWAQHVGWRTRVETAAWGAAAGRDLVVVGATVVLGGAAWALGAAAVGGLVVVGGTALVVLGWSLLPR
ncbi:hypothetical protein [Isoptericola aurantiacus]|uniref:hypothetical protein n=1 Tax=Isoptericola aurantiacus TaxID=3377839 RepID=UPI00383ABBE5